MNKMIRSFLALATFGFAANSMLAQPAVKLIVVDMAKVYDNHHKFEEATAKLRGDDQKAQEQVEELNKQGQLLVEEYKALIEQSKNTVLTAEARSKAEADSQKKLEEIQRKQGEVQNFRNNTQRSLQTRLKNVKDLLLEEISKIAIDIAKAKGATLVMDKSGPSMFGIPSVLYSDAAYDITDDVLAAVNKDRPAPSAAVVAPAAATAAPAFTVPNVSTTPATKK